ncbi:MAG: hypothetical protein JO154_20590 [Chitinophaga sp.]|uniref:hypothetical protein n=1 Tax=Chitinophaga sp. TaxID=1869181 RepID=UPI0025C28B49|nr:hypothetical protein [Chitinophaga sp.]MBV8255011.1 hypothetical protein [Chitinophaga sp.]
MSNKRVDFGNLGGFPLTQDLLSYMQSSYRDAISGMAKVCGNNVIISGMEDNGTSFSDGWIVLDGELLPFVGGPKQSTFIIVDENSNEAFADGISRTVYFTRYARFGSGGRPISDLFRLSTIGALQSNLTELNSNLTALNNNYGLHAANKNNPHGVTKQQVGLGNIPNAISDDPTLNDSNVLATTKATAKASKIVRMDSVDITGIVNQSTDKDIPITIPNGPVYGRYLVAGSLRSYSNNFDNDNDVFWMVRGLGPYNFVLCTRKMANNYVYLMFDYAIILF